MKNKLEQFIDLLAIGSYKNHDTYMIEYICIQLEKIEGVNYQKDNAGNILVTKYVETANLFFPCFCCHTDTVHYHDTIPIDIEYHGKEIILSSKNGIGGDDKNGIFVILEMLKNSNISMKAIFFANEETGFEGASKIDLSFFDNISYLVEIDRKNNSDIIRDHYCVSFDRAFNSIAENNNYYETMGSITDVLYLQNTGDININAINISCGFYEPHTKKEIIVWSDVMKCYDFCMDILQSIPVNCRYIIDRNLSFYYDDPYRETAVCEYCYNTVEKYHKTNYGYICFGCCIDIVNSKLKDLF